MKQEVEKLKRRHWMIFLATAEGNLASKALSYTVPHGTGSVALLYQADRNIATDQGRTGPTTLLWHICSSHQCNLSDVPWTTSPSRGHFPLVPAMEVKNFIAGLAGKKVGGRMPYQKNILKLPKSYISRILAEIFNACLKLSFFPSPMKRKPYQPSSANTTRRTIRNREPNVR